MNLKDSGNSQIGLEAARWLMRLQDGEFDPQDAQAGERGRDEAFLQWLLTSPRHVQVFLETFQAHKLIGAMDPQCSIKIHELLGSRNADVISLHGTTAYSPPADQSSASAPKRGRVGRQMSMGLAAAALLALTTGAWFAWRPAVAEYSTAIGEQRTCKLDDGSFVYLNTDSRVEVRFSASARHVRLIGGEALFVIERDSRRPFVVNAGEADIRVLGTQFNVRRRDKLTDIAVVEGTVQVSTARAAKNIATDRRTATRTDEQGAAAANLGTLQVTAGQEARIASGKVTRRVIANLDSALAWRARRLVFTEATLPEVVTEFNRYNRRQMRIEGAMARTKKLTGIFDADRPNALIMYAMKDEALVVEPDGADWVIRAR